MFIVITGLDGSGTSSVAELLHSMDKIPLLLGHQVLNTPIENKLIIL